LLFTFLTGCSVIKRNSKTNIETRQNVTENNLANVDKTSDSSLVYRLENQNLTKRNFFIQKAEVLFSSDEDSQRLTASIKFNTPDKYLISIRSKSGIEGARIFMTRDTILVNDRINRKLYYGKPDFIARKYGISAMLIPVILGDYSDGNKSFDSDQPCADGIAVINAFIKGIKIRYTVECRKNKIVKASQESGENINVADIEFEKFFKTGGILTPGKITIKAYEKRMNIDIRVKKMELPWDGNIEFIPGNKYELIELR
jgi:hypothetical protein